MERRTDLHRFLSHIVALMAALMLSFSTACSVSGEEDAADIPSNDAIYQPDETVPQESADNIDSVDNLADGEAPGNSPANISESGVEPNSESIREDAESALEEPEGNAPAKAAPTAPQQESIKKRRGPRPIL